MPFRKALPASHRCQGAGTGRAGEGHGCRVPTVGRLASSPAQAWSWHARMLETAPIPSARPEPGAGSRLPCGPCNLLPGWGLSLGALGSPPGPALEKPPSEKTCNTAEGKLRHGRGVGTAELRGRWRAGPGPLALSIFPTLSSPGPGRSPSAHPHLLRCGGPWGTIPACPSPVSGSSSPGFSCRAVPGWGGDAGGALVQVSAGAEPQQPSSPARGLRLPLAPACAELHGAEPLLAQAWRLPHAALLSQGPRAWERSGAARGGLTPARPEV